MWEGPVHFGKNHHWAGGPQLFKKRWRKACGETQYVVFYHGLCFISTSRFLRGIFALMFPHWPDTWCIFMYSCEIALQCFYFYFILSYSSYILSFWNSSSAFLFPFLFPYLFDAVFAFLYSFMFFKIYFLISLLFEVFFSHYFPKTNIPKNLSFLYFYDYDNE